MIRAITFDVTGTLVHTPRMAEIYAETLARHGIELPASEVARLFPVVWKELDCRPATGEDRFTAHPNGSRAWWARLLERLCELAEAPPPDPFAAAELWARFARAEAWELYPDVVPALDRLRRAGLLLGVVSNWDERLPAVLEAVGLAGRFDAVIVSSAVGVAKPAAAIFRRAVEALGVAPGETLHVGDHRVEDVEGAVAAGLHGLLIDRAGSGGEGSIRSLEALDPSRATPRGAPAL